jgi:hypothetical protein
MKGNALYLIFGWIVLAGACTIDGASPVEPSAVPQTVRNDGGSGLRAVFVQGDYEPGAGESLVLTGSECSGVAQQSYNVDFKVDDCLSMTTTTGVVLEDDAYFAFAMKRGFIVGAQFWIDDQSGPEGIGHESNKMALSQQTPSAQGFTLHVHAQNVPVWRLAGHLSKKRVAPVGTVSIGDVIYYAP